MLTALMSLVLLGLVVVSGAVYVRTLDEMHSTAARGSAFWSSSD